MIIKQSQQTLPTPQPELYEIAATQGMELDLYEAIALHGLINELKPSSETEEAIRHDVMMARTRIDRDDPASANSRIANLARVFGLARLSSDESHS